MGADRVRVDDGLVVAAEDEERERGGVLPDRRVGLAGTELQRPASRLLGRFPVSGEHERLHRADRTPPAPGGSAGDALAVALGRTVQPLRRLVRPAGHQEREPGAACRVPHPRQLPLARVRLVGQPSFAVLVASRLPREMLVPAGHSREDNLLA